MSTPDTLVGSGSVTFKGAPRPGLLHAIELMGPVGVAGRLLTVKFTPPKGVLPAHSVFTFFMVMISRS